MLRMRRSLLLGSLAAGLSRSLWAHGDHPPPLQFGLMPYLSTQTLIGTYQPLVEFLRKTLAQPLQSTTAQDFPTFMKRVDRGEYDLALIAPHFAQLAQRDYGYQAILTHSEPIRSLLVVDRTHPLPQPGELKGQAIAIADRSGAVVIAGIAALSAEGLESGRDYRLQENATQSSALHSVLAGQTRAAIISAATLNLAPAEIKAEVTVVRELARLPGLYYIAHNRLTAQRRQAVKAALRLFETTREGQAFFRRTGHGGFREPMPEDSMQLDRLLPETRRQLHLPASRR